MSPAAVGRDISRVNERFAREMFTNRNAAVVDEIYTEGARLLPPSAPMVTGRENIRAFWQSAVEALQPTGGNLETLDLEVLGDTAIEVGRARADTASGLLEVKYVVIWKREAGEWKPDIDTWNQNS